MIYFKIYKGIWNKYKYTSITKKNLAKAGAEGANFVMLL